MTVIDAPAVPATAAAAPAPALRLEGIGHRYGSTQAVADVTLEVAPGRVLALVGPSGCGKSTLLRLVAGLLTPSSGSLHLDGEDATRLRAERRRIGYVPQSYALFPHLSVRDNAAYGLRAQRVPRAERDERVDHALELTRMTAYADRSPAQLSGGQRQRVALARALAIRPRVLLLDEPLSALDPQLRDGMRRDLRRLLAEADCCTIIVTHDQAEALALADEVAVMRAGRLVQRDTVEGVWSRPADPFVAEFVAGAAALPARVADDELVVGDGWRMPVAAFPPADGSARVDGPCFAVVRPVGGASLHAGPVAGSRPAVVVDVEPRGSSWSLRLRLVGDGTDRIDGSELTVSSAVAHLPGHAVHLRLDAPGTTVHALPADADPADPAARDAVPARDAEPGTRTRTRTRGRRA
jgi:ABC-type Fe3+/spermidine/putrescine transport system ATPase subunit